MVNGVAWAEPVATLSFLKGVGHRTLSGADCASFATSAADAGFAGVG
jgi:hypothetical protein